MNNSGFRNLGLIQNLREAGITNQVVLNAILDTANNLSDVNISNLYSEAKILELFITKIKGKILLVGNRKTILADLLKTLESSVDISPDDGEYSAIIVHSSQDPEPKFLISKLETNGVLIIERVIETGDVVKITKTKSGFIKESYDEEYCRYH